MIAKILTLNFSVIISESLNVRLTIKDYFKFSELSLFKFNVFQVDALSLI